MTVSVSEYDLLAVDANGHSIMTGSEPALATQDVTLAAGSTQSAAFTTRTKLIRLHSDAAFRFVVGDNPTALATSPRIAAGATEFLGVKPGLKIAVIQSA